MNCLFNSLAEQTWALIGKACVGGLLLMMLLFAVLVILVYTQEYRSKVWSKNLSHPFNFWVLRKTVPTDDLRYLFRIWGTYDRLRIQILRYRLRNIRLSK